MRLVLISLDGLWEKDFEALKELPHIGRLIREGASCKRVQTIYPALTYPVHTTILTGCPPALHGIPHNQPFAPDRLPAQRPWYWEAAAVQRPTLHQVAARKGLKTASILWPVTGKSPYIHWNFPEVLALPGENQTVKMLRYGSAAWILRMELLYGRRRKSVHQPDLDDYAALLAQKLLLSRRPPDLLTLHLVDCDEMRHHFGAQSREADEAIRRLDSRVGGILQALGRRRHWGDTVVALISDHGLWDVSRPVKLDDALAEAGFSAFCKCQTTDMGAFLHLKPDTDENLARVKSFLEENSARLGIAHVYGPQELAAMGAGGTVRLAVDAAEGVLFEDALSTGKRVKATHGFGPAHPAAQCLFILSGPGVRRGVSLPHANMEDIAPTVASILEVNLPGAIGRILSDCFIKDKKVENNARKREDFLKKGV